MLRNFLPSGIKLFSLVILLVVSQGYSELLWNKSSTALPEWLGNQVIYEINVRQYSDEGSFAAIEADLDRIDSLGINTLWFMPIHSIGEVNRKGLLGSYYAIKDYLEVNPEFGTDEDFRSLVNAAHAKGMHVLLDWVGNHTAWDNPLTKLHPDYYMKDAEGHFVPPTGTDWTDVIQLDFESEGLLEYQIMAMRYWVEEFGVDGYRCDFAIGVPTVFWNQLSAALLESDPDLFLLAEAEESDHQLKAFHASYGWDMMHTFNAVAKGDADANDIDAALTRRGLNFPEGSTFLHMTSNHDENSWNGTVFERLGDGVETFAALSFLLDGIPLLYNGQEVGLDWRLKFFERDPIHWKDSPFTYFYKTLIELKTTSSALLVESSLTRIPSTQDTHVYAFVRGDCGDAEVLFIANLSDEEVVVELGSDRLEGNWNNDFTDEMVSFSKNIELDLKPWQYYVLTR